MKVSLSNILAVLVASQSSKTGKTLKYKNFLGKIAEFTSAGVPEIC
ncbi:hypothetical protein ACQ4M3_10900 [Leptolyngbya sp. AN03gr2]